MQTVARADWIGGRTAVPATRILLDGEDVSGTPPEPELVRLTKAALKRLRQ